ncbi:MULTISPECIES: DUF4783 domain-containing protein [Roseivirga]|jgi:hypothetical protein|uniref:DUF4783 domain-containing protein n=1 Tax=Roseivirga spongicola TaxID=333140 RepID=A0A150XGJ7_9BACT|nr:MULTISPECIES: DUF4783 domain-containing protein [Roseivirga]KYG77833.1 hypothetical protein AWW68_03435 [Roseivirga spongicola]MBO6494195.1 DUF4783 domain-containing protein [Roseivirga sp.]MBO6661356.1 DUF4783 domain-containing protein [Roseivirga sp.]MBO6759448.1 DUF4783 domain-containing protein [Roseivirga sp.]MBO6908660.1 DUF4783 domain-containing protein [Roseivirga sp.]|tara:strand:- start:88 stop:504 length:417 start_codon:yes stop_codon:yes gene_type:complete
MKTYLKYTVLVLTLFLSLSAFAQKKEDDNVIIVKVEESLKASSSKELIKYLHSKVEIKLDGERKEYSSNQAEIMLKQFFQQYPSTGFEFNHDGTSTAGGIIYAIGTYASSSGNHRVVIRAKKFSNVFKVYRLEFTKER